MRRRIVFLVAAVIAALLVLRSLPPDRVDRRSAPEELVSILSEPGDWELSRAEDTTSEAMSGPTVRITGADQEELRGLILAGVENRANGPRELVAAIGPEFALRIGAGDDAATLVFHSRGIDRLEYHRGPDSPGGWAMTDDTGRAALARAWEGLPLVQGSAR